MDLQTQADAWPSPGANDYKGSNREGQRRGQLDEAAEQKWPTPQATDDRNSSNQRGEPNLRLMTQAWQTPSNPKNTTRTQQWEDQPESLLPAQAESFLQARVSVRSGRGSSAKTARSRPQLRARLNPRFVEWLMGWPLDWTDYAPVGTEWSHWSRRMRSALCGLVLRKPNEP